VSTQPWDLDEETIEGLARLREIEREEGSDLKGLLRDLAGMLLTWGVMLGLLFIAANY
jgi:hypothetical protein